MKITDMNKLCDLVGDIDVSIIGHAALWSDIRRDYPALNLLLDEQPDEIVSVVLPVIAAYIKGWMRANGHKDSF